MPTSQSWTFFSGVTDHTRILRLGTALMFIDIGTEHIVSCTKPDHKHKGFILICEVITNWKICILTFVLCYTLWCFSQWLNSEIVLTSYWQV
jgi:hypothetical protein